MATLTDHATRYDARHGLLARIVRAVSAGIENHARKASRRDKVEALERKTDAELARIGLRREDIAHHVFRDLYYI
ncbi:hypothetical protein [Roseovarius salis]|uniref:hypothetical protein n=1 Tax=Roseovarius salis TaxID=3376063 RepID=UPI0037C549E7